MGYFPAQAKNTLLRVQFIIETLGQQVVFGIDRKIDVNSGPDSTYAGIETVIA